ncbi:LOW QUALITY PROTEIN: rho GTPase-activating protein 22 [Alosa sapidissima]|uniref:LOW QUALITY PROTEIN: rho GTPase-activating protein 22 n=1 Tax=Alosa sapidissima TaxID=34773 RepID=UPI001C080547|nr:LOW QUALITY PROTEIN: rho GTPase-activating protein 22 [Alosa sapidissima]
MTDMLSPKIRQARRARSKSMVMGEVSRAPCRPTSPSLQEGALRAGWLRKQRSIMKNWQLRWFVLRADALYFYKDQEETKPQGCIALKASQVHELTANPEEPGKHLFEIIPGASGEKERSGVSHEAFLLMANSQSDMDDWVRAIRRVIWAPFGGGIFGQRLEDTVQYERTLGRRVRLAPLLVEQCVCFIRQRGLAEEGLFRMPGQANLVKELQDAFDRGDKPQFDSNTDVHTVASLLKLYLRELPEPVIPFAKYEDFISCAQLLSKDEEEGVQELVKQVKSLPPANYSLLKYICRFLDEVQSHSSQNKMSVQNLATVFGPNILRPKMEDPVAIMEGTSLVQHLMTVLISEHERLYPSDPDAAEAGAQDESPPMGQRAVSQPPPSLAGWISEEDLQGAPTPPASEDTTSGSSCSLDAPPPAPTPPQPRADPTSATSPSKQPKSAPSWKYSFKGPAPRAPGDTGSGGQGAGGSAGGGGGGNWLMNGLSSLRGHRRASSGERTRDSGSSSSHRLSTYDNVASCSSLASAGGGVEGGASGSSSPWSASSCEISVTSPPPDSTADHAPEPQQQVAPASPSRDEMTSSAPEEQEDAAAVAMEIYVSGADRSDRTNARAEDSVDNSQSLGNLVVDLKEELRRQKTAYEARIQKLEDSSAALCSQMERLEQEMEQERKRQRMLEIKLRNSERARQDAENRNRLLEQEMEEFFSTLGDLALGARTSDI